MTHSPWAYTSTAKTRAHRRGSLCYKQQCDKNAAAADSTYWQLRCHKVSLGEKRGRPRDILHCHCRHKFIPWERGEGSAFDFETANSRARVCSGLSRTVDGSGSFNAETVSDDAQPPDIKIIEFLQV